jgi:hypothetical protein
MARLSKNPYVCANSNLNTNNSVALNAALFQKIDENIARNRFIINRKSYEQGDFGA